ncbi:MAG: hypothetical protein JWP81_3320 [Ferruginibacter sp.]|nr:hypothetical protein [Ferruginibacter sp.]
MKILKNSHKRIQIALLAVVLPFALMAQDSPQPTQEKNPSETSNTKTQQPVDLKVEGKTYEQPEEQPPKVTRQELLMQVGFDILKVLLTPRSKPKQRSRGEDITLANYSSYNGYKGNCTIYQYTNNDFPANNNSSAQAAMASALYAVGSKEKFPDQKQLAANVWEAAPPKITLKNMQQLSGTLGTDWKEVNQGLDKLGKQYGIQYAWIEGIPEIKKYLSMQLPVMVMLDAGALPELNNKWWVGHWVTAFAYDNNYVYVTNFPNNRMTWSEFDAAFKKGKLAVGHGTDGKAVVVWK